MSYDFSLGRIWCPRLLKMSDGARNGRRIEELLEAVKMSTGFVGRRSVADNPEEKPTTRWCCFDKSRDAASRAAVGRGVSEIKEGKCQKRGDSDSGDGSYCLTGFFSLLYRRLIFIS